MKYYTQDESDRSEQEALDREHEGEATLNKEVIPKD